MFVNMFLSFFDNFLHMKSYGGGTALFLSKLHMLETPGSGTLPKPGAQNRSPCQISRISFSFAAVMTSISLIYLSVSVCMS